MNVDCNQFQTKLGLTKVTNNKNVNVYNEARSSMKRGRRHRVFVIYRKWAAFFLAFQTRPLFQRQHQSNRLLKPVICWLQWPVVCELLLPLAWKKSQEPKNPKTITINFLLIKWQIRTIWLGFFLAFWEAMQIDNAITKICLICLLFVFIWADCTLNQLVVSHGYELCGTLYNTSSKLR